jgi:hypothetical protein
LTRNVIVHNSFDVLVNFVPIVLSCSMHILIYIMSVSKFLNHCVKSLILETYHLAWRGALWFFVSFRNFFSDPTIVKKLFFFVELYHGGTNMKNYKRQKKNAKFECLIADTVNKYVSSPKSQTGKHKYDLHHFTIHQSDIVNRCR